MWRHQVTDGVAIVIGSMTLFLLVVTCMAQLLRPIGRQSKQLSRLTRVDELTGLPNRRAWSAELPAAIERALLPGATAELATSVLERLRGVTPAGQTFSAGVAAWDGNETSEELITRGDQALYQAKDTGRDRILAAAQTAPAPGR